MKSLFKYQSWKQNEKTEISKLFYGYVLIVLAYNFLIANETLPQMAKPPLLDPQTDLSYWLIHLCGIPQLLSSSVIAGLIFTLFLFASALQCFWNGGRKKSAIFFSVLFLLYFISMNSLYGHHGHSYIGILMGSFIFWTEDIKTFSLLFRALRYYTCFILASAAIWKITMGLPFEAGQMKWLLLHQHADALVSGKKNIGLSLVKFLIENPGKGDVILWIALSLQLSFFIGFITQRFDRLLLILFILFFLGDLILMGMSFYPMWVLLPVFGNWKLKQPSDKA